MLVFGTSPIIIDSAIVIDCVCVIDAEANGAKTLSVILYIIEMLCLL